jgi:hypothetical protein
MFWNKKNKLPITEEDKIWINEDLNWLRTEFGEQHFMEIKTVTPTKKFFNRNFDGTKDDAKFVLERTMELMNIHDLEIQLEFFSDSPIEMTDGTILSTSADHDGFSENALGTFTQNENETIISIEIQQLKNPISLIATISHELAHQILLGEKRIDENDELLTDLMAIAYGFGIFIGNSRFNFSTFSTNNGSGWQTNAQGYLPEQIIAYSMAWLSYERKEETVYREYLDESIKSYFEKSLKYIEEDKG